MGIVYLVLSLHLVHLFGRQVLCGKKESRQESHDTERFQQKCTQLPSRDIVDKVCHESVHSFPLTNLILHTPWQAYLLLAILDVEANYLTMLSFQHTSLSSSMLLTSLSVFSTLLFRRCIFGKASVSYSCKKIVGVFISVVGACLWIRKDFHQDNGPILSSSGHEIINGDLLAIASALLYGLNDVLLEFIVKANNDRIEYLGMIGLFGFLFSCCVQAPILETKELSKLLQNFSSIEFPDGSKIVYCVFVVTMSYFYISVTVFLSITDATILNLSLQSSPLWAVILTRLMKAGIGTPDWDLPPACFFVGFAMVVCGMFLYEAQPVKK
jgi:solute carrier family 35 protein F1/2